jgi:hypothetical protein
VLLPPSSHWQKIWCGQSHSTSGTTPRCTRRGDRTALKKHLCIDTQWKRQQSASAQKRSQPRLGPRLSSPSSQRQPWCVLPDTGALLSWLQSTTRHGAISAYHSIQSYGVPHAARKQWTWEQDPRRHCGIPSRLEEGAPAPEPEPEPRLGPFLSRSRYFLFLLGVQLGKQGVFSVPLDPHAR